MTTAGLLPLGPPPATYAQTFDAENRLAAVTTLTGTTQFLYGGDGNRVLQLLPGGGRTAYIGAVEVRITGTQRITRTYYSLGGQMVAMRVVSSTGNVLYYLHGDHLGSVSLVTCGNAGGCNEAPYQGAVSRQLYSSYGTVRWQQGVPPTDIGFTGQRADATGLMYYQARYYHPGLGRFISADTLVPGVENQALNRYMYVEGNTLKYIDVDGHKLSEPRLTKDQNKSDPPPDDEQDSIVPPWKLNKFDTIGLRISGGGGSLLGVEVNLDLVLDPQNHDNAGLFFGIDIQFGALEGASVGAGLLEAENVKSLEDYGGFDWGVTGEVSTPYGGLELAFDKGLGSEDYCWYISPIVDVGEKIEISTGPGFTFEIARYENGRWQLPPWFLRFIGQVQ